MALDENIVQEVALSKLNVLSNPPLISMGFGMLGQQTTQRGFDLLAQVQANNSLVDSQLGNMLARKMVQEVDVIEAVANQKMLSGNDLAQQTTQLISGATAAQILAKTGQTTPPVSSPGPVT